MEQKIEFTHNWNNKLSNDAFTTLRPHNTHKYVIGSTYMIYKKDTFLGNATIIDIKRISVQQINNYIALLDTGYPAPTCINIIKKMYKCADSFQLDFILLRYIKKEYSVEQHLTFPDF